MLTSVRLGSLRGHLSGIHALIIRDLMVRFGRENLGFVWTILEPMILTAGVLTFWSLLKEPVIHGVPVVGFALTGYMPLTVWRHMTNSMVRLISNNAALLYHVPLSHLDIVLARLTLEFLSTTTALAVMYVILLVTGLTEPVQDWGLLLTAWLFTAWYHAGIGLLIVAATERSDSVEKFIQPAQYLALPLSGVFFMVDWLPSQMQRLILWNPAIHCFEMFRAGYFGETVVAHFDPLYLAVWSFTLTVLGVVAVLRVRDHVHT